VAMTILTAGFTILRDIIAADSDTISIRDSGGVELVAFSPVTWTTSGTAAIVLATGGGPVTIATSGIADHFFVSNGSTHYLSGSCSDTLGDLVFNDVNLVAGGTLTITALQLTVANCM